MTDKVENIPSTLTKLVVPVDGLTPYPRNPRRGDVGMIAESLSVHGQYRPIVVRAGSNEVLAGNHTLAAAKQLGWKRIAATFVDVDDDTAARIVLVDNRASDVAGYDDEVLATLLAEFEDLVGTGYAQDDVDALLASNAAKARDYHTDPDAIPEPPSVAVSQPGTLWLLGRHRLLCGDSTSLADVARLMDGKRARLMATDPPYLVDYDGGNHPATEGNKGGGTKHWDSYVDHDHASAFFHDFLRVALQEALTKTPTVYQWHADGRVDLVYAAWRDNGLLPHQVIIWAKDHAVLTFKAFMQQHESCLYGWLQGHRQPVERRPPANSTSVWSIDQHGASNDYHPTEKPVEIFGRPLRWHLRRGELAFEPFSGSGSQIIAAEMEQRTCYAIELSPRFVDVAARRYQEFTGELPVDGVTGEPYDFTAEVTP